jgi:hypothetical protein
MVYKTQNYWVFGLFPSLGILELENTTFRKLDLFPFSGVWGKKTRTQLGPLERANLSNWITGPVISETSCFLVPKIPDDEKSPKTQ